MKPMKVVPIPTKAIRVVKSFFHVFTVGPALVGAFAFYRAALTQTNPAAWVGFGVGMVVVGLSAIAVRMYIRTVEYSKAVERLHDVAHDSRRLLEVFGTVPPDKFQAIWVDKMNSIISHIGKAYESLFHERPLISIKTISYEPRNADFAEMDGAEELQESDLEAIRVENIRDVQDPGRPSGDAALKELIIYFTGQNDQVINESKENVFYWSWNSGNTYVATDLREMVYYTRDKNGKANRKSGSKYRAAIVGPVCFKRLPLLFITLGFRHPLKRTPGRKLRVARYFMKSINDILQTNLLLWIVNSGLLSSSTDRLIETRYIDERGWPHLLKAIDIGSEGDDEELRRVSGQEHEESENAPHQKDEESENDLDEDSDPIGSI